MMASNDNVHVIAPPPMLYAAALASELAIGFPLFRIEKGIPASVRYGLAFGLWGEYSSSKARVTVTVTT